MDLNTNPAIPTDSDHTSSDIDPGIPPDSDASAHIYLGPLHDSDPSAHVDPSLPMDPDISTNVESDPPMDIELDDDRNPLAPSIEAQLYRCINCGVDLMQRRRHSLNLLEVQSIIEQWIAPQTVSCFCIFCFCSLDSEIVLNYLEIVFLSTITIDFVILIFRLEMAV